MTTVRILDSLKKLACIRLRGVGLQEFRWPSIGVIGRAADCPAQYHPKPEFHIGGEIHIEIFGYRCVADAFNAADYL